MVQAEKQVSGDKWQACFRKCLLSDRGSGFVLKHEPPLCRRCCQLLMDRGFQRAGLKGQRGEIYVTTGDASGRSGQINRFE